ncbi:hypothetical protein SARC_04023 [Sphaeroforma arctica JP610]|uniref:Uncharacterized protein n=1 Tax=Sphaeroforma arctica JP610 TaxID=667725 RepID=A0A0L0G3R1_9EUKA|nr:hypothetical protein SARC_04023 [Sphaeroforma arctica JP610]KNC83747.1 hypothetical protein SARC_04023 [Sphaeroforma arctica JP610]|eukprot:XP_014157649.1 hypothetical protein SARC_04023 [Sphaeroforma arctica JP610]
MLDAYITEHLKKYKMGTRSAANHMTKAKLLTSKKRPVRVPSEASVSPSAASDRELKPDINSNEPKSKSKSSPNPKFEVQHTPESENKSRIESKPNIGTFAKCGRKKRRSINAHGLSDLSSESSSDEYVPSDDSGDEHSKRPAHKGRGRDEDERSKGGGKKGKIEWESEGAIEKEATRWQ